jgi:hypothetical protein
MNDHSADDGYVDEEVNLTLYPCYDEKTGESLDLPNFPPDQIIFNGDYSRVFNRPHIAFFAQYQGRSIRCEVPWTVLASHFNAIVDSVDEAEAVFLANRAKLEESARALIEKGQVTADDKVHVQ